MKAKQETWEKVVDSIFVDLTKSLLLGVNSSYTPQQAKEELLAFLAKELQAERGRVIKSFKQYAVEHEDEFGQSVYYMGEEDLEDWQALNEPRKEEV